MKKFIYPLFIFLSFFSHNYSKAQCAPPSLNFFVELRQDMGDYYIFRPTQEIQTKPYIFYWDLGIGGQMDTAMLAYENYGNNEGIFHVKMIIYDTVKHCYDSVSRELSYYPYYAIVERIDTNHVKCTPWYSGGWECEWDMGDGAIINDSGFIYEYKKPGIYQVAPKFIDPARTNEYDTVTGNYPIAFIDYLTCGFRGAMSIYNPCYDSNYLLAVSQPTLQSLKGRHYLSSVSGSINWGDGHSDAFSGYIDSTSTSYSFNYLEHKYVSKNAYLVSMKWWDSIAACGDSLSQNITMDSSNVVSKKQIVKHNNYVKLQLFDYDMVEPKFSMSDSAFNYYGVNGNSGVLFVKYPGQHNLIMSYQSNTGCPRYFDTTITFIPSNFCGASFVKVADTAKFKMYILNLSNGKNYHWDFGDGDTSNQKNPNHTYSGNGNYLLKLTVDDTGCLASNWDSVGFNQSGVMNRSQGFTMTMVDKLPEYLSAKVSSYSSNISKLTIFPNPSTSNAQISIICERPELLSITLRILDVGGKEISKVTASREFREFRFLLPELRQGFYYIQIPELGWSEKILIRN